MARTVEAPDVDMTKLAATTEEDIHRHMVEDGEDPDAPLPAFTKRLPGQRGPGRRPAKAVLNLRVDPSVLEAWRATGPGWQARMNDVLAEAVKAKRA